MLEVRIYGSTMQCGKCLSAKHKAEHFLSGWGYAGRVPVVAVATAENPYDLADAAYHDVFESPAVILLGSSEEARRLSQIPGHKLPEQFTMPKQKIYELWRGIDGIVPDSADLVSQLRPILDTLLASQ